MTEDRGLGLKKWLSGPRRHEAKGESVAESVAANRHRVAVLPFASLSPDSGDEYFADGMTEEVISTLSRVPEVEVISRTSVMRYKKDPKPVSEVSRDLDVGTVLEGSVRKAGNKLRITIQMVDPAREHPVWADSFDRELQDVFAIQSEVAARVARALLIKKYDSEASRRKNPTSNPEAYALYLKGRYYWNKRGPENVKSAVKYFEGAVKEDPRFALGYVGLADSSFVLASSQIDPTANHEKSKAMIARALELEPSLTEAIATKGLVLLGEFRVKEAEKEFRSALFLNPSYAPVHLWYHQLLRAELRWNEALTHIERAISLDPLSPNMYTNLAQYYYAREDTRTALDAAERSLELDPSFAHAHYVAGYLYGRLGMISKAKSQFGLLVELTHETYPLVEKTVSAWLAFMQDNKETVKQLLPEIEADPDKSLIDSGELAILHFYLGEDDQGFDSLDRGFSRRDYALLFIQNYIEIPHRVRVDPRYPNVLKKLGLNEG